MRELMKVNLAMLKKMKWLWIILPVFTVVILLTLTYSVEVKEYSSFSFLYDLLGWYPDYAVFSGCFVCLFLGREYSRGTLRNKIIAGYSRIQIYASYFLTSCIIIFICFLFPLLIAVSGTLIIGVYPAFSLDEYLTLAVLMLFAQIIEAALSVLICMIMDSTSKCIMTCIILFFCLIMLLFPFTETVGTLSVDISKDASGNLVLTDADTALERGSLERTVAEDVFFSTPILQFAGLTERYGYKLAFFHLGRTGWIILFDFIWLTVIVAAGILVFQRKKVR